MVGIARCIAAISIAFVLLAALGGPQASAQSVTLFPIPTANSSPEQIAAGPDGALWFTEGGGNKIGRITTGGVFMEFPVPTGKSSPDGITAGPDGALWFTELSGNNIGQITTAGAVAEFPIPTAGAGAGGITVGADGALWFTESDTDKIAFKSRFDASISEFLVPSTILVIHGGMVSSAITAGPDGAIWSTSVNSEAPAVDQILRLDPTTVPVGIQGFKLSADNGPTSIIKGPDGNLWFTEENAGKVGRMTTGGTIIDEFMLPANFFPEVITVGPDGALWFTDEANARLGRISTSKVIAEFALPTSSSLSFLVTGPDGALWFTDSINNRIGRMTVPTATSPLFSATLPASRSIQIGHTATAFASIINSGATTALNCGIAPVTSIPGSFTFQTTDPKTNALIGPPNARVSIGPGKSQSFVVAFATTTLFDSAQVPIDVVLGYECDGIDAAATIVGVNTLKLTFDQSPVPDVIAVGLTPSNDGFAHTAGVGGVGLFATASSNVGVGGTLTARVRLSDTTLPITATVCETNPNNGACLSPPAPTVTTTINAGQNQTWSVFLNATGMVAADPAHNRAFFEFVDGSGVVRGSTSTAVTTQ